MASKPTGVVGTAVIRDDLADLPGQVDSSFTNTLSLPPTARRRPRRTAFEAEEGTSERLVLDVGLPGLQAITAQAAPQLQQNLDRECLGVLGERLHVQRLQIVKTRFHGGVAFPCGDPA